VLSSMVAIAYANSICIIRTLSGGIASLNVGTPETPFDVHLELLCDSSPYFNRLFIDRFARVPPATVRLPDDDPGAFTEFLNWVYRGTIFQNQLHPPLIELFRLWVLADKFEVPELQNLAVLAAKSGGFWLLFYAASTARLTCLMLTCSRLLSII
jgi:hypothetical protein